MEAMKFTVKMIHEKEIVVGVNEGRTAEETLKALFASEEWHVYDAELVGVVVEKMEEYKENAECPGECETCPHLCPDIGACMIDEENYCDDCEYLCPKCGRCTIEDDGDCGEEECEKCHWCCPECGGCMHPEGKKQP